MEDELIQEFVNESREHLSTIEADLLAIEEAGAAADDQVLNKVFRAAHSIKGAAGFFDFKNIKELAHKAETVLDMLRSRKMIANAEITNVLLRAFDKLRELVNSSSSGADADITNEVEGLQSLASSYLQPSEKPALSSSVPISSKKRPPVYVPKFDLDRLRRENLTLVQIDLDLIHDIDRKGRQILQVFHELENFGEIVDCSFDLQAVGTLDGEILNSIPLQLTFGSKRSNDELCEFFDIPKERIGLVEIQNEVTGPTGHETNASAERPVSSAAATVAVGTSAVVTEPAAVRESTSLVPSPAGAAPPADETLRVNVSLLDTLMNLAGELVLSRNQFQAAIAQNNHRMLTSAGQRLSQITSEIQDAIMRTRLQPIENVFSRLPRVVRDLSNALGKDVRLDLGGKEVALDRSLVEGLSDPLTHMVRNAIDHGIEMPDVRKQANKPRTGTLRVEARHEAGQVVIEIADDGKGIDEEKVAKAALAKGLVTTEQLKGMSADERAALILLPGLSTAEKVTQVSGRGVGMDVVKTNLDRLGGQIEISSKRGQGTLFRIKLPLTLTIIPALIVSVGQERFAIPQINVEELLRVRGEERQRRIEVIGGTNVLVLRERILPLVRLDDFLGVPRTYRDSEDGLQPDRRLNLADRRSPRHALDEEGTLATAAPASEARRETKGRRRRAASAMEIAVITTGTFRYGLVVESFHNTEEIVVKPLGRDLKESREYAGATILGDGAVALILDGAGLAVKAEVSSVSASPRARDHAQQAEEEAVSDQVHSFLLFRNREEERCALPLEIVRRIERIKGPQVETKGGRRTLKYRDRSLPLVTLSDAASVREIDHTSEMAVIVSSLYGHEVGLLVAMPVDVCETDADIDTNTHRQPGISGSSIIREETTLLVDLMELVNAVYPEWRESSAASQIASPGAASTVLLAEDSDFFRAQVKRFLESDGYQVLDAPDGEDAWKLLLENLNKVRVLVTDIEMPRLSGLQLSARIRADERTKSLPIIAVSSLAGEEDVARAKQAGVDEYQIKLDRDTLLAQVGKILAGSNSIENDVLVNSY